MDEVVYAERDNNKYTEKYTVFGGMDVVLVVDKKIKGEIQSIAVDSMKKEITIGILSFVGSYEKESVDFYKSIKDAFILEAFANEYGDHACFRYNKVTYKGYRKNHDIDSTSFIDQYIYSYEDEEYIE
jgi:hypothetical protein